MNNYLHDIHIVCIVCIASLFLFCAWKTRERNSGVNKTAFKMADKGTFVGARLRVSTNEGDYEGTVHSIDVEKRKVTLSKGESILFNDAN